MIEISNLTNFSVDRKLFSTVAKKVLMGENRISEKLSLAFVSKEEIKKLNKKFRKKNKPTDVLSFELNDAPDSDKYLGEIVICPEIASENAKKYEVPLKKEVLNIFIHGILHLCGYKHEKSEKDAEIMEKKQGIYLSKIIKM